MAIDSIGSTESSTLNQSTLGQEDLFKILLTQLNYQDPLKPMDNQEFIAQLAQFTSLEQARESNEKLGQLIQAQSVGHAISLLNHDIQVSLESGSAVGKVTAINFSDGRPLFTITRADGPPLSDISLSQVEIINGDTSE
ncbi:flagellar hook assembly protein FlgD [Gynuella sunshinyii]|uniref:Basal-body rod modification protein FlgD n=1 Tax=Gynuella sunshinyii YC6258 TaxID=1445510 RepID=A0A0C5UZI1_9GAMM|nr:flagellar hook capping FlgD N-terminal domain-containing protein [Gynuella sunshinyii]AJQ92710.1 flagellar hook capping protein [Gynuella sunshinyii YC6258]